MSNTYNGDNSQLFYSSKCIDVEWWQDTVIMNPVRTVELFHALAWPDQTRNLDELKGAERCVCELIDCLEAGRSQLSFHCDVECKCV